MFSSNFSLSLDCKEDWRTRERWREQWHQEFRILPPWNPVGLIDGSKACLTKPPTYLTHPHITLTHHPVRLHSHTQSPITSPLHVSITTLTTLTTLMTNTQTLKIPLQRTHGHLPSISFKYYYKRKTRFSRTEPTQAATHAGTFFLLHQTN